jgi:hypothetical protein
MTGRIETREQVRAELRRLLAEMTRKGPVKQSDIIAVFNDRFELSRGHCQENGLPVRRGSA